MRKPLRFGSFAPAALVSATLLLAWPSDTFAADLAALSNVDDRTTLALAGNLSSLGDAEVQARSQFIEERLDDGKFNAQLWQYGWTTFYAANMINSSYSALVEDDHDTMVYHIVNSVKSAGGTIRSLYWPLPARLGASQMQEMPTATRDQRVARLEAGEAQLRENAAKVESRYEWRSHAYNIGANLIGGAVIATLGDLDDAAVSSIGGVLIGELSIWSRPWRARQDLADYESQFGGRLGRAADWQILAAPMRAEFRITF